MKNSFIYSEYEKNIFLISHVHKNCINLNMKKFDTFILIVPLFINSHQANAGCLPFKINFSSWFSCFKGIFPFFSNQNNREISQIIVNLKYLQSEIHNLKKNKKKQMEYLINNQWHILYYIKKNNIDANLDANQIIEDISKSAKNQKLDIENIKKKITEGKTINEVHLIYLCQLFHASALASNLIKSDEIEIKAKQKILSDLKKKRLKLLPIGSNIRPFI